MNIRFAAGALSGSVLISLTGCSLWKAVDDDVPPPPLASRQARLMQVPDDLRLPRVAPTAPAAPVAAPAVVAPVPAAPVQQSAAASAPAPAAALEARTESQKQMFAPYMPSSNESLAPKTWVVDPSHDFPWVAGAQPTRVNEETTMGVGARMFGRLFAKVEFGTGALAAPVEPKPEVVAAAVKQHKAGNLLSRFFKEDPKKPDPLVVPVETRPTTLHAAGIQCTAATCLDAARDMLIQDAERKGWKSLLNRRVSLHQSFQFQREDRVIWIEVNSDGKNSLQLEYGLLPTQK